MNIDAIPTGKNPPDDLNVIIEVPMGGEPIKYEIDKASGALFVDRFLYTPMRYPGNYGFVPHTLCGDGDPLDVIVMNSRPLVPGAVVRCRPIGVLFMEDDGGQDEKILAVPVSKLTKMYDDIKDIGDMQAIQVERVKHFFTHYKDLEPGKWAKISHVGGYEDAKKVILDSIAMHNAAKYARLIMTGRIVILNGAPRSGKTSIAKAMQDHLPGQWINLGVDAQNRSLPAMLQPGIGLRPGGERPDLEPSVGRLYLALYDAIAAHARQGFDVVADLGHHDFYSRPLDILPACARRMTGIAVLFVGVHCPIDEIMRRRNADPAGYVAGDGVPEPVRRWQESVHVPGIYDLAVDTGTMSPKDCVAAIAAALSAGPPTAFQRLAAL